MVIQYKGIYGVLFDDSCYSTGDDTEMSRSHPQASSTRKGTTSKVSKEVEAVRVPFGKRVGAGP